jgi:glycosyltransferase involved in cell wall biosynthesis
LRWFADHGHDVALAAPPAGALAKRAGEAGIPLYPIEFHGQFDPRAILRARRAVAAQGAQIVDCRHGSRDGAAFAFARPLCPVVRSRHIAQPLKGKLRRRLMWRRGCDHVIATAECVKRGLVDGGLVASDRVTVVGEWAADAFFDTARRPEHRAAVRREFSIPDERPVVSVIGMVRDDKAQDVVIETVDEMRRRGRPVSALIVGSAPIGQETYERSLHDLTRKLGLIDQIVFTGYRDDVPRLAQASDALVVTSRIEAQSRTVPQAFASAVPVVASNVGGVGELVTPGETGWLVEAGDVMGYADALGAIFDAPEEARRVTEQARRYAEGHLTQAAKMAQTLALYERLAGNRNT